MLRGSTRALIPVYGRKLRGDRLRENELYANETRPQVPRTDETFREDDKFNERGMSPNILRAADEI